jgi:3-isopropylmalate/(R)-2-methylmalate dehydratase small subunit
MEPFRHISAVAAPLSVANIDTDMLVPARFLKTVSKEGLGKALFASQRYYADGEEKADFILNRQPWRTSRILVTLGNFGCGSSREHAPWALVDFGIRCVIAPSFADIFYSNCFKNGILPITLDIAIVLDLLAELDQPDGVALDIDLAAQIITLPKGNFVPFVIDPMRRERLLAGTDDIAHSLEFADSIASYEDKVSVNRPWIGVIPESAVL